MITAFVFVKAEPRATAALGQQIADIPGVRECFSTMGEWDLTALLWVENHDEIARIVPEHISMLPGVLATNTVIAYRAYSTRDQNLV